MGELPKQILAEKQNVEEALDNLNIALDIKNKSTIELAAIGTFLHNIYNGIENILKQITHLRGIEIHKSESWHKDLINLSVSKGIISEELSDRLYEYLTFRHFFIHSYGFMLEEKHLEGLAKNIHDIWARFVAEISSSLNQ